MVNIEKKITLNENKILGDFKTSAKTRSFTKVIANRK